MTTAMPIATSNCIGRCSTETTKPLSRIERTKSFLKSNLIKRWKSSKELFTKPLANFSHSENSTKSKIAQKVIDANSQNGKFINEKVLDNLDEFERNFLLSAGRKILVRELRKNFEKPQYNQPPVSYSHKTTATTKIATKVNASNLAAEEKPKILVNASVQTIPTYEEIHCDNNKTSNNANLKKHPLVSRHSFYNTYRNEYCAYENNHYASNLSLISHGYPTNREKCLEKTINKYKNTIKSSSALDLSSISTVVLNSTGITVSTGPSIGQSIGKASPIMKRHYCSVVNISHSSSSQNLTDLQAVDYDCASMNSSAPTYALIDKPKHMNNQLKATHSIKSLSTTSSVRNGISSPDYGICNRNGVYNTKSLVATSTPHLQDIAPNDVNASNFNRFATKTVGSNLTLEANDGNNNTAKKIRKCYSITQVDLDLLKNELDEYIHRELRATNYGQITLAQRRYQFESNLEKELDLEQKIDLEIKMREGSAKLLAACNNPKGIGYAGNLTSAQNTQILEAAKNLLTSNERMTAYMAELQRRKRDRTEPIGKLLANKPKATAKVSLSELRMPLMWRDTDHFKNKGDHRRFAVFCLIRIGTDIFDTSLLCPVDRSLTDISFNDVILFSNVEPDFELKLEVYAVMMETDLTIASTPRKIKNTIHSSISRTVGKRLASNLKDELNNAKIGPKFEHIASATLTIAEASDLPHTHDLTLIANYSSNNMNNNQSNNKLPLFGHFCCRLAVQPDFMKTNYCAGKLQLSISPDDNQLIEVYARLQAFKMTYWNNQNEFDKNLQPKRCIEITRDTKVKRRGDVEFIVWNMEEGVIKKYLFRTNEINETTNWETSLKRAIKEHLLWKHVTVSAPMQLTTPGTERNYFLRSGRHGSLYDQVPILQSRDSNSQYSSASESGETSDLRNFRSRANSSSSNVTSSKRSHWPFGK